MGINRLDTFFAELYKKNDQCFKKVPLKCLRLVIDGALLPHIVNNLIKRSEFGGSYDELYDIVKKLFTKLKPITEVVIFHGPEYNEKKSSRLFKNRLSRIHSIFEETCRPDNIKYFPPMFTKAIIFEVLKELDMYYLIADKDSLHTIACYANGMNRKKEEFTILGYETSYFVYNLTKGYIPWAHLDHILLANINFPLNHEISVFYLTNFLILNNIKLRTWHYLCMICGEIDKHLYVKRKYMKMNNLEDVPDLLNFLRYNEIKLMRTNYKSIRESFKDESLLEMDERIKRYNFDPIEHNFINSNNYVKNDNFTCVIESIKNLKVMELKCYIEDMEEESCFWPAMNNQTLDYVYKAIADKSPELNIESINEAFRILHFEDDRTRFLNQIKYSGVYNYLEKISLNKSTTNSSTLFYTALCFWYSWLESNQYVNDCSTSSYGFLESIITNLILINVCEMKTNIGFNHIVGAEIVNDLVSAYHQFRNSNQDSPLTEESRQIIHRLNEFQAIYYSLGLLNKAADLNFELMSVSLCLNAHFIMVYIKQQFEWDVITNLIDGSDFLARIKYDLMNEFQVVYKNLYGTKAFPGITRSVDEVTSFIFAKRGATKSKIFNEMAQNGYDINFDLQISTNFDRQITDFHRFPNHNKIYVSNVDKRLSNNDLEGYFKTFGNFLAVKIINNIRSPVNSAIVLFRDLATPYYIVKKYQNEGLYADIDGWVYMMAVDRFVSRH